MKNILFLCTGNSARSIMAEAYMNHAGKGIWKAYSAGSKPTGTPNPHAIWALQQDGIDPGEVRSKSWDEFAANPNSPTSVPVMDAVVTVCDNAAGETCPVWPTGSHPPAMLHWSFPDPAAAQGNTDQIRAEFQRIYNDIKEKIDDFLQ